MNNDIRIAAALVVRGDGRTLLVRKRGAATLQQPGGKIDPDETAEAALLRELAEEIGLAADPAALRRLGAFAAPAANEPGRRVVAELFLLRVDALTPAPGAEIAEAVWIDPDAPGAAALAPLTGDVILPFWRAATARSEDQAPGAAQQE